MAVDDEERLDRSRGVSGVLGFRRRRRLLIGLRGGGVHPVRRGKRRTMGHLALFHRAASQLEEDDDAPQSGIGLSGLGASGLVGWARPGGLRPGKCFSFFSSVSYFIFLYFLCCVSYLNFNLFAGTSN
jgi:hypothetical protein